MKKYPRLSYLLTSYLLGIVVFTLFRVVNTLVYCNGCESWPDFGGLYPQALFMGWRFDTVISCYFLALPALMLIVAELAHIRSKVYHQIAHHIIVTLCIIGFLACAADIPFFNTFFIRLDAVATQEADSIGIIANMIVSEPRYIVFLFAFLAVAVGYWFAMRCIYRKTLRDNLDTFAPLGWAIAGSVLLALSIFIGMRGRLSKKSPIRVGTAYFCNNPFLNQIGLNPVFTFIKSAEELNKSANKPLNLTDAATAEAIYQAEHNTPADSTLMPAGMTMPLPEGTNVVMVIMESMTAEKTCLAENSSAGSLTPVLDSLMANGLVFTRTYSAGIHTYNGIYSSLYSHPALLARHTMKHTFVPQMDGLPQQLKKAGYNTAYLMTHDENFDNMQGFLYGNAFDSVIGQSYYPKNEIVGTWGIPDHVLMKHAVEHCNEAVKVGPFLTVIMTCSDHPPFYLPDDIDFHPSNTKLENQMVEYADYSIGELIRLAQQQPWFDNTLFVFIADHGQIWGANKYDLALSYHHVPMLFYYPGKIAPSRYDGLALQIDLGPTLLGMMPFATSNNTCGLDLLRQRRKYAYFSADEKIGVMDDEYYYVYRVADNEGNLYHFATGGTEDMTAQQPQRAESMRQHAFGMLQWSFNKIDENLKIKDKGK